MARRRKPAWPVLWFTVRIGPSEWRVLLSVPSVSKALESAEGATEFLTSTIYLRATMPHDRLPDIYMHEAMHAAIYVGGIQRAMAWTDEQEETAISLLAPVLAGALLEPGHLTLPPLPPLPP